MQLAKLGGAYVIGTSSSPEKLERAAALGMDAGIDYTKEDVPARVAELTGGNGVDLVFEHVGGELFQKAIESLSQGGRLVTCGAHAGEVVPFDIIPFFRGQHSIIGSFVYSREELETRAQARRPRADQATGRGDLPARGDEGRDGRHGAPREFFGKILVTP